MTTFFCRYKYLVLGHEETYFVKEHSDSKNKYSEDDIIKMLEFLVDNCFVVFAGKVFQQTVGIPMGTHCAPLLADIFLYPYEADLIQSLLATLKKQLAYRFNPSSPAYGVFISQLIRYARACSSYECFILRARRLSSKLLKQGYLAERLKLSFRKFYGRYGDLIQQYEVSLSRMLKDILILDQQ